MRDSFRGLAVIVVVLCAWATSPAAPAGAAGEAAPSDTGFSIGDAFREVQLELRLARSDTPYLVIAPARGAIEIRLKGALVWACPLSADSSQDEDVRLFGERFRGSGRFLCRPVEARHVYAYAEQLPDSILATIAEATGFAPELIQRDIPARMFLSWGDGLLLEVRTDIEGSKKPRLENALFDVRRAVSEVGQSGHPVFRTTPESALTLARMAKIGTLTLLDPTN